MLDAQPLHVPKIEFKIGCHSQRPSLRKCQHFQRISPENIFLFKGFDSSEGNKHFDLRKCDHRICDMIKLCRDISKMFDSCTKAMLVEISFG